MIFHYLRQRRWETKVWLPCTCLWNRVYHDRSNSHLMVLWLHGCLFPAFLHYHIRAAGCKSSPANTDLKSSNKDHNIKSAFSVEPTDNSALRKRYACLSSGYGGCLIYCLQNAYSWVSSAKCIETDNDETSHLKLGSESLEGHQHSRPDCTLSFFVFWLWLWTQVVNLQSWTMSRKSKWSCPLQNAHICQTFTPRERTLV